MALHHVPGVGNQRIHRPDLANSPNWTPGHGIRKPCGTVNQPLNWAPIQPLNLGFHGFNSKSCQVGVIQEPFLGKVYGIGEISLSTICGGSGDSCS